MKKKKMGDSSVQHKAEEVIRKKLEKQLKCKLQSSSAKLSKIKLDGFCNRRRPVCVEIWAHQGPAKSAQMAKIMKDMCKLLLAENLLGKPCRKVFAVTDQVAVYHLKNSWQGEFADAFGIEIEIVSIDNRTKERIRKAQKAQYR